MSSKDENPSTERRVVSFTTSGKSTRNAKLLKESEKGGPGSPGQRQAKARFLKKMDDIAKEYKAEFLLLYYFSNIKRPDCNMHSSGTIAKQFEIKDSMNLTKAEFLVDCEKKYRQQQQKMADPIPAIPATVDTVTVGDEMNEASASSSGDKAAPPAPDQDTPLLVPPASIASSLLPEAQPPLKRRATSPAAMVSPLVSAEVLIHSPIRLPGGARPVTSSPAGHPRPSINSAPLAPPVATLHAPPINVDQSVGAPNSIVFQKSSSVPSPSPTPKGNAGFNMIPLPAQSAMPFVSAGVIRPIRPPGGARPASASLPLVHHPRPSINTVPRAPPVAVISSAASTQNAGKKDKNIALKNRPALASLPLVHHQRPSINSASRAFPVAVASSAQNGKQDGNVALKNYLGSLFQQY